MFSFNDIEKQKNIIKRELEKVIDSEAYRKVLKIPIDNKIEKYYSEYKFKEEKNDEKRETKIKIRIKWLRYGEEGLYTIKSFTLEEIKDILLRINKIDELNKEKENFNKKIEKEILELL